MKAQLRLPMRMRRWPRRGRPPVKGSGVPHLRREELSRHHAVHVTLRIGSGVPGLRRQRVLYALEQAFAAAKIRFGMRIVHFSIQGNHLHLIVEAEDRESLAKGMQGLAIRVARAVNRLFARAGQVWADRYHSHVLKTRREAANALRYVLGNFARHAASWGERVSRFTDAFSSIRFLGLAGSDAPVAAPRTWLLRVGWQPG